MCTVLVLKDKTIEVKGRINVFWIFFDKGHDPEFQI